MTQKDWYSPHSVSRFTKPMVRWLVPLLPLLRNGEYPPNPKETGYIKASGKPHIKASAKFETPAGIAAELDKRIQHAGIDGLMMEFLYASDPDDESFKIEHMAQCMNMDTGEVSQRIRDAMFFVSGGNRKTGSYSSYIRQNYRSLKQ